MGCKWAVDVAQFLQRGLVFTTSGVDPATEMRKDHPLPENEVSILCLDGFDYLRRVETSLGSLDGLKGSSQMEAFTAVCARLGLPVNTGKRLVSSTKAVILGGGLADGRLGVSSKMASKFWWKS